MHPLTVYHTWNFTGVLEMRAACELVGTIWRCGKELVRPSALANPKSTRAHPLAPKVPGAVRARPRTSVPGRTSRHREG